MARQRERREPGLGLGRISKGNESSDPNYGVDGCRPRLDCRRRRCCMKGECSRGMSGRWNPSRFLSFFPFFWCGGSPTWAAVSPPGSLRKVRKEERKNLLWPSFPLIYPTTCRVFSLVMPCISPLTHSLFILPGDFPPGDQEGLTRAILPASHSGHLPRPPQLGESRQRRPTQINEHINLVLTCAD